MAVILKAAELWPRQQSMCVQTGRTEAGKASRTMGWPPTSPEVGTHGIQVGTVHGFSCGLHPALYLASALQVKARQPQVPCPGATCGVTSQLGLGRDWAAPQGGLTLVRMGQGLPPRKVFGPSAPNVRGMLLRLHRPVGVLF